MSVLTIQVRIIVMFEDTMNIVALSETHIANWVNGDESRREHDFHSGSFVVYSVTI